MPVLPRGRVDALNQLREYTPEPLTAFGETVATHLEPRIQIDAVYGIRTTDHETFTDGASGTVAAASSVFVCTTGTSVGGYGVIRSKRIVRYRPGQGIRARFTAYYSAGVANSLLISGLFSATDGLFFGYSGTTFGILRRVAGAAAIHRLTVSAGAGGAETITVTLNDVAVTVSAGGVLTTTATAELIAERVGGYTGWSHSTSPTSNGATVTFIQGNPAATAGAFTLSSTGTAAGTFATVQAGAANDNSTGFVAQTAWNVDVCDGSRSQLNQSGFLLDPSKLNVFQVVYPFLGAGPIRWYILDPVTARWNLVHVTRYPNTATIPSQRNPIYRLGWAAASLGSTSNLTVAGASAAAFTEGAVLPLRNPNGRAVTVTAGTTEYVAIAFRVRGDFGSTVNQAEVWPHNIQAGIETGNRSATIRVYLNPTMTGAVAWAYQDQTVSVMEYATPTSITPSAGQLIATTVAATGGATAIDLASLDVRIQPGDTLAISVEAASNTASTIVAMTWQEN